MEKTQIVLPDQCDRIVWRGKYYHLPIAAVAPAQAEPVNAEALHAECKRVAHNAIHDAIYKIDDCEPVKDAVRDALDSIDLSEYAATQQEPIQTPEEFAHMVATAPAQAEPSVPEGWKLVPVQPTQEMCQVAQWKLREWPRFPFRVSPVYQAMLEAAPTAPVAAAAPVAVPTDYRNEVLEEAAEMIENMRWGWDGDCGAADNIRGMKSFTG